MLQPEDVAILAATSRPSQLPLSLMTADLGASKANLSSIVKEVAASHPSLICIVGTGLDKKEPRSKSGWPEYSHVRQDGVCGGLVLHYHKSLRVEELPSLVTTSFPGIWVAVRKAPVRGVFKEEVIIVGAIFSSGQAGLESHLASCVMKMKKRFGSAVSMMVAGDGCSSLMQNANVDSLEGLQGLRWSNPSTSTFLLHSSSFQPIVKALQDLGPASLLCSLPATGCPTCNIALRSESELTMHKEGEQHRRNLEFAKLRQVVAVEKKHPLGLEVDVVPGSEGVTGCAPEPIAVNLLPAVEKRFRLQLSNWRNDSPPKQGIVVASVSVPHWQSVIKLEDEHGVTREDPNEHAMVRMKHGKNYKVTIICCSPDPGEHRLPVVVTFYHETHSKLLKGETPERSQLVVEVLVRVESEEVLALLPKEPFQPVTRHIEDWHMEETVPGWSPARQYMEDFLVTRLPLGDYPIKEARQRGISNNLEGKGGESEEELRELEAMRILAEDELSSRNYSDKLQLLLHIEQVKEEKEVRQLDMSGVEVKVERKTGLVVVEVPHLQEGRLHTLRGDKLFLRRAGDQRVEYEAFVHKVMESKVWLGGDQQLVQKIVPGSRWDIRFSVNLHPARLKHRALSLASTLGMVTKVLFPKSSNLSTFLSLPNLKFFSPLVEGNPEQRTAVQAIVSKLSGSAPYVVFGPPGTGKTVTLVEAIKQAWRRYPDAHILATAPSNTAADLLTEHLAEHISKEELLRLHAASRNKEEISPVVAAVSNLTKEGEFTYPALPLLMEYKVVVTTLVTSGRLVSAVVPSTHFNFVFIDEAGQATEPETVIALAGLVAQHTNTKQGAQVVMAGDPKQLGPVVVSRLASQCGLDISLLERLMNLEVYSKGKAGFEGRCITKLVRNFRSHPGLLALPSQLFYDGELLPCADPQIVDSCLGFRGLTEATRGSFPFLFHGVVASEMREGKSPSFFNPSEVVVVLGYVATLIEHGMVPANIGVIAPYKKQVFKIRDSLALKPWGQEVKVGTTEEFQGQEKLVIIISTVRSSPDYINTDDQAGLGFLANPKRFNVAITRAKALMIVVGNPTVLCKNQEWSRLVAMAVEKKAYTGCSFPHNFK